MDAKVEVRKVVENRNRTFYALYVNGEMWATQIWDAAQAEYLAQAVRDRAQMQEPPQGE